MAEFVRTDTDDEVTELIHTLNQMLERLRDHEDRHRQFVSDASHELRTRSREHGGPGLGLAIVHAEVTAAGGTVSISTSPAGGARFTLEIPSLAP